MCSFPISGRLSEGTQLKKKQWGTHCQPLNSYSGPSAPVRDRFQDPYTKPQCQETLRQKVSVCLTSPICQSPLEDGQYRVQHTS